MIYKLTPDGRDPWTQSRIDTVGKSDINPQAPAGGGGPGRFTSPGPLGLDLSTGTLHPDSPAASTIQVSRIVFCSATTGQITGEVLVVRIGSVYKIEGFINGQPVVYIGSSAEMKTRFEGNRHMWEKLIRDPQTRISIRRVYGKLNVPASGQKTIASATQEALRVEEEKALRETEQEVQSRNEGLKPGESETTILNKRRAAQEQNMVPWRERHNVSGEEEWLPAKEAGSSNIIFRAFVGLQILDLILDAINHERTQKMAQYIRAPFVFVEEDGRSSFTVQTTSNWWGLATIYTKHYLTGSLRGKDVEISQVEFTALKDEAEFLYGYIDWWGDFVPGLLVPKLPVMDGGRPGMRA